MKVQLNRLLIHSLIFFSSGLFLCAAGPTPIHNGVVQDTLVVPSGSSVTIASGATITNNGTAIGFGGAGTWGNITGALSSQTDLSSALSLKLSTTGNGSGLTGLTWSQIGSTPTTAAGYNITNGGNIDLWGAKSLPTGAVVGTTDTQTLTNKSIAASEVNSGTLSIAQIPTGTTSSTVAVGNDSRITGALQSANNLGDLGSAAAARISLHTKKTFVVEDYGAVADGNQNSTSNPVSITSGSAVITSSSALWSPSDVTSPPKAIMVYQGYVVDQAGTCSTGGTTITVASGAGLYAGEFVSAGHGITPLGLTIANTYTPGSTTVPLTGGTLNLGSTTGTISSGVSGTSTIVLNAINYNIVANEEVTGTGITGALHVTNITYGTSSTTITLDGNLTGTASGTFNFKPVFNFCPTWITTTIASYQSPTQITLASSMAQSTTASRVIWGTDNTTAVQNCWNAAKNAKSGHIVFSNPGIYCLAGNLQNTSTNNSVIALPNDSNSWQYYEMSGVGPSTFIQNGFIAGLPTTTTGNGTVIVCFTNPGSPGTAPSVFSANGALNSTTTQNAITAYFHDLGFLMPVQATISTINMYNAGGFFRERCQFLTDYPAQAGGQIPATSASATIFPNQRNNNLAQSWNCSVTGFGNGDIFCTGGGAYYTHYAVCYNGLTASNGTVGCSFSSWTACVNNIDIEGLASVTGTQLVFDDANVTIHDFTNSGGSGGTLGAAKISFNRASTLPLPGTQTNGSTANGLELDYVGDPAFPLPGLNTGVPKTIFNGATDDGLSSTSIRVPGDIISEGGIVSAQNLGATYGIISAGGNGNGTFTMNANTSGSTLTTTTTSQVVNGQNIPINSTTIPTYAYVTGKGVPPGTYVYANGNTNNIQLSNNANIASGTVLTCYTGDIVTYGTYLSTPGFFVKDITYNDVPFCAQSNYSVFYGLSTGRDGVIGWTTFDRYANGTPDTGISKDGSGVIDFGNGGLHDKSATLQFGGLRVTSGTNSKSGTFTLISGSKTVANTAVTANSVIQLTCKAVSGTRAGNPDIVISPGTGFTASGGASDSSTYNYWIEDNN